MHQSHDSVIELRNQKGEYIKSRKERPYERFFRPNDGTRRKGAGSESTN